MFLVVECLTAGLCSYDRVRLQAVRETGAYRLEGNQLNMNGWKLEPLKTEEVRITVKPTVRGAFILKPKIVYSDEAGKHKSHVPRSSHYNCQ